MTFLLQLDHSKLWFFCHKMLPIFWLSGLSIGLWLYCNPSPIYFSLMRGSVSVSIVGCMLSSFIPFLISAFAVIIRKPFILLATVFLKGCFFAYISIAVLNSLGQYGWIIRLFFMLSDICSLPLLYAFWNRCLRMRSLPSFSGILMGGCLQVLMICMDVHLCNPFFAGFTIL